MTDIQSLISLSLKEDNNWRELLSNLLKEKFFPSMIYSIFFLLSPSSQKKFSDLSKQALVLGGALKIIMADDNKKLEKSSDTRRLVKRMKHAHKKHKVSDLEFHHMKQAISITSMFYMHNLERSSDFTEFERGFTSRIANIRSLVVANNIQVSDGSSSK